VYNKTKVPVTVLVGLCLAIVLDTAVQLCWKIAVMHVPECSSWTTIAILIFQQPLFYAAMIMFLGQFFNWMHVLSKADLSFAQPITALGYVSVCGLSALWLHEMISPLHLLGITLILVGVYFISQTEHNTSAVQ
jgi:drug/metabolite transporter (DMT)-like permease